MALGLFISPVWTFVTSTGAPASGWKLYSYAAGTANLQSTYLDSAGATPNANPVVLNTNGQATVYLLNSAYKFVLTDASGVTQWTQDNVTSASYGVQSGYMVRNVSGNTDVTLLPSEYANTCIEFTGTLTGNINVIVPVMPGYEWILKNSALGNYTITFKTSTGTGVTVPTTFTVRAYCDTANISSVGLDISYGVDTGTANAYAVTYPVTFSTVFDGLRLRFRAANANTGASTFSPNGKAAAAIWNSQHSALVGGEIIANSDVEIVWNGAINGGSGAWVLLENTAGISVLAAGSYGSTPAAFDNTTKIATTAFVESEIANRAFTTFAATVNTNALTGTLTAPYGMQFRNPTLTSGAPVSANIAANLTLTVPSTATLGTINNVAARLVWLVAYNGGSPVLCVTNLAGGLNLDETTLISPTTISGTSNSANVIYSASAVSANSPFRVVGFCDITEATAGTWATGPTTVQGMGGQALAGLSSVGYGQTWQAVTRIAGTTYYNTTGKPIVLSFIVTTTTNGAALALVNGLAITGSSNATVAANWMYCTVIIPPGASYVLSANAGTPTVQQAVELR